jgi:hypothetical protein
VGLFTVNRSHCSEKATGLHPNLWHLPAMMSVLVLWSACPARARPGKRFAWIGLRAIAALALAYLLFIFGGTSAGGEVVRLQHSWWGILGMIGWAYLLSSPG